jgi:hypothetical protein
MAKAIRQIGLKLVVGLLRLLGRPAAPGWQRSRRPVTLRGR